MVNLFKKPNLSSFEVTVCAKHEVLMDADDDIVPSIGDPEAVFLVVCDPSVKEL
jgi:hypothetical protein